MRDISVEVGVRIREVRKKQLISQENLANMACLDRSYMGRIERGEVNITIKVLYEISLALNVEMSELIPSNSSTVRGS